MWTTVSQSAFRAFELWLLPWSGLPPFLQLCITAVPLTAFALIVFRFASNQAGITRSKDLIKGYLLELWLYKDDPGVLLRAQAQVAVNSFRYLGHSLAPLLIMSLPMALVLVQVEAHFGWRSPLVGESIVVTATLAADAYGANAVSTLKATLSSADGIEVETPAMRLDNDRQVLWRLRAVSPGKHTVRLKIGDAQATTLIQSGTASSALAPMRYQDDDWRVLGYPAAAPLATQSLLESIAVAYPRRDGEFLGLSSASWVLMGICLVLGFAMRGLFGVTF